MSRESFDEHGESSQSSPKEDLQFESGEGKYSLFSIISHIGKNTDHGHYVCHIKKNNQWVLFNDEKVGKSQHPPLGYGYIYIYRRNDSF